VRTLICSSAAICALVRPWANRVTSSRSRALSLPTPGADPSVLEERLRQLCRSDLAGYKQPRAFELRTQLPLGPAGKILKRELRDGYRGST
jgi:acyl-CoA synthetase (AMP-forming)/AMP-acid ligase II